MTAELPCVTDDWRAALLRVSMFLSATDDLRSRDLWREVISEEPVSHEKKRGEIIDQGPCLHNWLVVKNTPSRIDWLLLPTPDTDIAMKDLGPFDIAIESFTSFLADWFERKSPSIVRLALGATAVMPVPNRQAGYTRLSKYLQFALDAERSSDFMFRINRRRTSRVVDGLPINRLATWSVLSLVRLTGAISMASVSAATLKEDGAEFACQVELDINSAPDVTSPIHSSSEARARLLNELKSLATEIVAKGDVP